jgi:hypothetical protein
LRYKSTDIFPFLFGGNDLNLENFSQFDTLCRSF